MAFGLRERTKEGEAIPTRSRSNAQEKAVAKAVGGTQTPNSGATPWIKGDVSTDQWLIECKTKMAVSESMSIKKDWITKNRQEAVFMGKKYSAVAFNFGPGDENHYIIDEDLFLELVEYLKNKDGNN